MGFRTVRNRVLLAAGCAAGVAGVCLAVVFGFSELGRRGDLRQASPSAVPAGALPEPSSAVSSEGGGRPSQEGASSAAPGALQTDNGAPVSVQPLPGAGKVVYMTFDDGPSDLTVPLLDILDRYHVKATFFVVGVFDKNETADLKEIVGRGQAIGVHSYTHDYRKVYASNAAFFSDADKMHDRILRDTGVDTRLFRFAGGSVNAYDRKIAKELKAGLAQRGYVYYDWNVSSGDGSAKTSAQAILSNALNGVRRHRVSVVLFHNSAPKQATLSDIPKFIETLQGEGYRFASLDPPVDNAPFVFGGA